MYNEHLDALAAEYVLGTLAANERIDADTLIATDPEFREVVDRWERRLGEVNGIVEAAELPPDKIESGTSDRARSDEVGAASAAAPAPAEGEAVAAIEKAGERSEAAAETKAEAAAEATAEEANSGAATGEGEAGQPAPPAAAMSPEGWPKAEAKPDATAAPDLKPQPRTPLFPPETEGTQSLARRLRRWRLAAAASSLVAVALATLMALRVAAPDRIALRALLPEAARPTPPASVTRLVAVLQQEPSSPAFLLTIDPAARTVTVRRVAAKAQVGHSYELWVQAAQAKPRALGLVGDADYTQQPLPSDFDVDAMRGARYEISFEPAGGSKSGAPTGPILFTGALVDSAQPPPPAPKS